MHQNKIFITNISSKVTKKVLHELLIQFSVIEDFFYDTKRGYAFVSYSKKKDMFYSLKMLETVKLYKKYLKIDIVGNYSYVQIENLDPKIDPSLIGLFFRKFGPLRALNKNNIIVFKKEQDAQKAVESCSGMYLGDNRIVLKKMDTM